VRPASPKYDQRNFFFSLARDSQGPPRASQRRPGSQPAFALPRSTPGRELAAGSGGQAGGGGLATAAASGAAALPLGSPVLRVGVGAEEGGGDGLGLVPLSMPRALPALRTEMQRPGAGGASSAAPPPAPAGPSRLAAARGAGAAAALHAAAAGQLLAAAGPSLPGSIHLGEQGTAATPLLLGVVRDDGEAVQPTQEEQAQDGGELGRAGGEAIMAAPPDASPFYRGPKATPLGSHEPSRPPLLKSVLKSALRSTGRLGSMQAWGGR
jgi:hypothetical protein